MKRRRQLVQGGLVALLLLWGLAEGVSSGTEMWTQLHKPPKKLRVVQVVKKTDRPQPKTPTDIADEARLQTRQLVAPDRSNVDCGLMKCIVLTYDDGPSPYTAELLDILKSRRAVATFFVLGREIVKRPEVLKRAVKERHELGNHTWSHMKLTALSDADVTAEIQQTDQVIYQAAGVMPRLIRPPYGAYDGRVAAIAVRPLALWSIDTEDWRYRDPNWIYTHSITHAHPGGIIVLHDIHAATVQATPSIIDELQRQGYVLATMSELFGIGDQNLPNFAGLVLRKR